ncbi:MAG: GAF domain-containing sensor histidine kinase [bacterium]
MAATPQPIERDAAHLLEALEAGVLILSGDLRVEYANARWTTWLETPIVAGMSFASLLDENAAFVQDELRATLKDRETRTLQLCLRGRRTDSMLRRVGCCVRAAGDGLVLEAHADTDDERGAMHDIARRLAEVTDMAEVLRTLCDIAIRQCGASGAAVLRVVNHLGEVVAAAGDLLPAQGRCFDLQGSLLEKAVSEQVIVSEMHFRDSGRPLMRAVPELALGPVIVAPLHAHGETLGVLAVARGVGGRPFRAREFDRLRMLADHAALAVHKSLLLMQAQSADKAKGRFLATMSHELRTPLTALAGYNELLCDQVIGPMSDPQLDILERMRSVTMHLSAMIEEILAFTSLEEGREMVRSTEFLLADLVRSALTVVRPLADQKKLKVEVSLPKTPLRMTSDIDKSRQILVNLLGNALKFTDKGRVKIQVTHTNAAVRIAVSDTGIGIADDEMPRLFRPFAQVDTGLTRRHGGTGLGLYISRRLATLLGGHLEVDSKVGEGSTFSVVLPLVYLGG